MSQRVTKIWQICYVFCYIFIYYTILFVFRHKILSEIVIEETIHVDAFCIIKNLNILWIVCLFNTTLNSENYFLYFSISQIFKFSIFDFSNSGFSIFLFFNFSIFNNLDFYNLILLQLFDFFKFFYFSKFSTLKCYVLPFS